MSDSEQLGYLRGAVDAIQSEIRSSINAQFVELRTFMQEAVPMSVHEKLAMDVRDQEVRISDLETLKTVRITKANLVSSGIAAAVGAAPFIVHLLATHWK